MGKYPGCIRSSSMISLFTSSLIIRAGASVSPRACLLEYKEVAVYGSPGYPDRETIESIKREVMDQIKFEQEHRGEKYAPAQGTAAD